MDQEMAQVDNNEFKDNVDDDVSLSSNEDQVFMEDLNDVN